MGKTSAELSDVSIIEVDLRNYALQPVNPTKAQISVVQTGQTFYITSEPATHPIAHRDGGRYQAYFFIENNKIKVVGTNTSSEAVIDSAYEMRIINTTTSERTYTKFKFIN